MISMHIEPDFEFDTQEFCQKLLTKISCISNRNSSICVYAVNSGVGEVHTQCVMLVDHVLRCK